MPNSARFGPFELDLAAGDLRRNGISVRLPEQQFQILQMLLLREGGVVSRDDIRKQLWPNDTVVEFDQSINAAIMKLRGALGDTADHPRFIETLARRGYRLVVPVELEHGNDIEPLSPRPPRGSLIGQKVSHYRVLGILGGGGMGLVYKGEDLRLNRQVALKFLPEEMATESPALQRFEREARTASSLNHPNICTIYQVEEYENQPFIVMELLEGETLREVISRYAGVGEGLNSLPLDRLLAIAIQIAEGLAAAHRKGIIHRDIKPANIFVTPQGQVKILDFGLAKIASSGSETIAGPLEMTAAHRTHYQVPQEAGVASVGSGKSIDVSSAHNGITMGTAGYMSPEQVRGENLDVRSDLFSFGLILFEMATGRRAFGGENAAVVQDAILHQALPDARQLNPTLPEGLDKLIRKALEKDRQSRYGDAGEILAGLIQIRDEATSHASRETSSIAAQRLVRSIRRRWYAGASLFLVLAALAYLFAAHGSRAALRISEYTQLTHDGNRKSLAGTDGNRLYFTQNALHTIAQVAVSGGDTAEIPVDLPNPQLTDVSPDGSTLLVMSYVAGHNGAFPLYKVPTLGGPPRFLTDAMNAAWSPDGKSIAYSTPAGDIRIIQRDGSDDRKLASVGGQADDLAWSPDASAIRFSRAHVIWEISSSGGNLHPVIPGWRSTAWQCCGHWTPDASLFVFRSGGPFLPGAQLWAIDQRDSLFHRPNLQPVQLTSGPIKWGAPIPSKDGKVIFSRGATIRGELVRFDSKSSRFLPALAGISAEFVSYSNDRKSVAYVSYPEGILWKANRDGSAPVQLTSPPIYPRMPSWSPDGKSILFVDGSSQNHSLTYIVSADGGTPHRLVSDGAGSQTDPDWSPDGSKIIFSTSREEGKDVYCSVQVLDVASHKVSTLPGSTGIYSPEWSPNGRLISGLSSDAKKLEIFDTETQKWTVAAEGVLGFPTWSSDGRFVYFLSWGQDWSVQRVRPGGGGAAEQIVDLKGMHFTGLFSIWMGLDDEDAPLFLRDTGSDDIYSLALERK